MASPTARLTQQQVFRYAPTTSVNGDSIQLVGYGTCTSNGAAGGTTLIDAGGSADSGSADTYNGRYWVKMTSGNNEGEMKRVVDDNGSGTLTLENNGFTDQVDSGDDYAIYLMPDSGVAVVTGGSPTTTEFIDTARDESDDFWNDYYAVPITGNARGEVKKITDFVSSTGTFTTEAFTSAVAQNDVVLIRKYVEVGNFSGGFGETYYPRPYNRVNFSKGDGVIGEKGPGPLSFDCWATASGTLAADTNEANRSVMSGLFTACGLNEVAGTTTKIDDVGAASTTTSLKIDTATHENFAIGQMILHAGNATFITGKTDGVGSADTLTVSPPLPVIPPDNDVIYGTMMYKQDTSGTYYGATIEHEIDGVRHTFFGCKGNVEFIAGQPCMFKFTMSYEHYARELEAVPENPSAEYTTTSPAMDQDRQFWADTTKTDIAQFTATIGTTVQARAVSGNYGINGIAGFQHQNYNGGGTFQTLLDASGNLDSEEIWHERDAKILVAVFGSHASTVAVRIPVARMIEAPHPTDANGMQQTPNVYEAQDAGLFADPTDGTVKIPDFTIHLA